MPNRLAASRSPYLRQHAENPVDWYPWGEEAFFRAKLEQKPVFLSVGYSSCHWCHVMAHESFEDEEVATVLNAYFICIKVDREELPDIDDAYMTAVQLSSGRGGWPMSVFLTPEKKPFFAATYFPKDDREQYPGFLTILRQIAQGWRASRNEFEKVAGEFVMAIRGARERQVPSKGVPMPELISYCLRAQMEDFDPDFGGFGEAPKFPPHTALELLLNLSATDLEGPEAETIRVAIERMAIQTLDAMILGGLRDHIGGGFHRYSTDRIWLLPHFEKMLYDNALMIANLAIAAHHLRGRDDQRVALYRDALAEAVAWVEREMTAENGMFCAAQDADTEGEEGRYYTWTYEEVQAALGSRAGDFIAAFGIQEGGNFMDEATKEPTGRNIPYRGDPEHGGDFVSERAALLAARESRVKPGRDEKCLAAWNGLMIYGLTLAGAIPLAQRCAEAWIALGEVKRSVVDGEAEGEPYLDDFAALALGLLTLADAVDDAAGKRYRTVAAKWVEEAKSRFHDDLRGGFFLTSNEHESLFGRQRPATDTPVPSANALMARCLVRLGDRETAARTIEALKGWIETVPTATEALVLALLELMETQPEQAESTEPEQEAQGAPQAAAPEIKVSMDRREIPLGEAGVIRFDIPAGWHLNSNSPPARWLIPTTVEVEGLKAQIEFPGGDQYEGTVEIPVIFQSKGEFEVRVRWQACTDTECLEPVEKRFDGVVL